MKWSLGALWSAEVPQRFLFFSLFSFTLYFKTSANKKYFEFDNNTNCNFPSWSIYRAQVFVCREEVTKFSRTNAFTVSIHRYVMIWEWNSLRVIDSWQYFLIWYVKQESHGGLYVCLATFLGFCEEHVRLHISKTSHRVFMHLKKVKKVRWLIND